MSEVKKNTATQLDQPKKISFVNDGYINKPGDPIVPRLKRVYHEKVKKEVVQKVGTLDIYEEIQASSNSTDLELLKRQALIDGQPIDPSGVGYGVNFSGLPEDIHQAYKIANDVEAQFSKLPEELRTELFGGSSDKFVEAFMTNKFESMVMSYYGDKAVKAAEEAKKKVEGGNE